MDALIGAIGLIGIVVGMILIVVNKLTKKKNQGGLVALLSLVLFIIAVMMPTSTDETTDNKGTDSSPGVEQNAEVEQEQPEEEIQQETHEEIEEVEEGEEIEEIDEVEKPLEVEKKEEIEKREKNEVITESKIKDAASLGLVLATVSRVVDGDTVELSDGTKVRLVGVNTPESTTRTEEYGKEASNYTKSKLNGKQIYLQKDVSDTDRYGRSLRLIWMAIPTNVMNESEIRSKMFNADLVLNGFAEPSTYPPDVTYSKFFVKFAKEARENNKGLWAYGENGTTKGDLDKAGTGSVKNPVNTPRTSNAGKDNFKNCTELRNVYPDGVSEGHPAYQAKMDRDKDGYACER
ncbi:thermonuclease family protein [Calidifontibacillus oryziterrae]|uniref:thermonuclease family protein n=1 Tax=Calidifontibacillus oryziterrae TaxID=1191699 RepID=UPI0002E49874|nr:thermonuclease family protein [Calidifontibacillus oryziterrae]